ncbi:MAG: hypothetical protein V5B32_03910 [Candidatus Accumulibacter sp. UW26]|jgi:hypothetical protein
MSDLRIALVGEGPTDYELIHAALRAVLSRPFVMTLLQPEETRPAMGGGWGGVLKWCHAARQRHAGTLGADPTLSGFDLLIIHLDVDVAGARYADCGPAVEVMATQWGWTALPCVQPCPPVNASCFGLEAVLNSWLGQSMPSPRTLYCLPAQCSGTWLAAAVLPAGHVLLAAAECNTGVESGLARLAKNERIRKQVREYRQRAPQITTQWAAVKQICTQAASFGNPCWRQ